MPRKFSSSNNKVQSIIGYLRSKNQKTNNKKHINFTKDLFVLKEFTLKTKIETKPINTSTRSDKSKLNNNKSSSNKKIISKSTVSSSFNSSDFENSFDSFKSKPQKTLITNIKSKCMLSDIDFNKQSDPYSETQKNLNLKLDNESIESRSSKSIELESNFMDSDMTPPGAPRASFVKPQFELVLDDFVLECHDQLDLIDSKSINQEDK